MNFKKSLKQTLPAMILGASLSSNALADNSVAYGSDAGKEVVEGCDNVYGDSRIYSAPIGEKIGASEFSKNHLKCQNDGRPTNDALNRDLEGKSKITPYLTQKFSELGSGDELKTGCYNMRFFNYSPKRVGEANENNTSSFGNIDVCSVNGSLVPFNREQAEKFYNSQIRTADGDNVRYWYSFRPTKAKSTGSSTQTNSNVQQVIAFKPGSNTAQPLTGGRYLVLDPRDDEVSKVVYTAGVDDVQVSTSFAVKSNELLFLDSTEMESDAVLKDFYIAGYSRPFNGSGGLTVGYQHALSDDLKNGGDGSKVGVSALSDKLEDVLGLVGQKACDFDNNCHVITKESLAESLRNHAIAEAVASNYNETQNLQNGYLSDVSKVIELSDTAKFLSETPIVRPLLPINNLVQSWDGADYTHHRSTESVRNQIGSNRSLENELVSTSLIDFENKVGQNVASYLVGGKK